MATVSSAMSPRDLAVGVQGVSHHFGTGETAKQVLFDVNLELGRGEIVIMTGPSGSGKTTLLTLVGGLRAVQQGSLTVLGEQLAGMGPRGLVALRRRIGFIFQAHNLFSALTATENVMMALELHGGAATERQERARRALVRVGLEKRLHHKPEELSGGQRQRVAIARALVNCPKLVLADEPTAALDKQSGRDVVALFQEMVREDGCTILLVTHDNRILDVADRIVNMVDGHVASNVAVRRSVEICDFLVQCPVFTQSTPATLTEMAQKMTVETHPPGAAIIRQGDRGDKFYVLRRGSADVVVTTGKEEKRVHQLRAGEYFGEIALLKDVPRTASVVAQEECEVYALAKEDFLEATRKSAPFHQQLLDAFFKRQ
jgi:putative ABC transport system ATP-binding protein